MWIRLRQIAFVAHQLEPVVDDLHAVLGLDVAYRDPGVATFGKMVWVSMQLRRCDPRGDNRN